MAKIDAAGIKAKAEQIKVAPVSARAAMRKATQPDISALEAQLETQLIWLLEHRSHPRHDEFEDQWLTDLDHYEDACDALAGVTQLEIVA
jgi:hypothetical protein